MSSSGPRGQNPGSGVCSIYTAGDCLPDSTLSNDAYGDGETLTLQRAPTWLLPLEDSAGPREPGGRGALRSLPRRSLWPRSGETYDEPSILAEKRCLILTNPGSRTASATARWTEWCVNNRGDDGDDDDVQVPRGSPEEQSHISQMKKHPGVRPRVSPAAAAVPHRKGPEAQCVCRRAGDCLGGANPGLHQ